MTRCTCICSCTVLESYPLVRVRPILALTCVNAERTLLSRSDTPSDLVFFAPYSSLRGVESCSSSSPPAGRPASRYSVLDGSLAGRPVGGTRTGLSSEIGGNSRHLPWLCFLRLRAMAGVSGEGLHYRAGTDYPRVFRYRPDNQEGESRRTARYFVAHWWDRTPRDDGRPSLSTSGKETKRVRHYCLAPVRREGFLRYFPA